MQCIVFMLWWFYIRNINVCLNSVFIRGMKCKPKFIDFQKSNSTWGIRGHDIIKYLNLITRYIILIKDYVSGSKGIIFRSLSQYQFLILKTSIKLKILFLKISWSYLFFPFCPHQHWKVKRELLIHSRFLFFQFFVHKDYEILKNCRLWNYSQVL